MSVHVSSQEIDSALAGARRVSVQYDPLEPHAHYAVAASQPGGMSALNAVSPAATETTALCDNDGKSEARL